MIIALFLLLMSAQARVMLSLDEALALAFPSCEVKEQTVYLTADEQAQIRERSGGDRPSALARQYVGQCDGTLAGTAYFDTHRVRTQAQTLMIVVGPSGELMRVEVLSFKEPAQYLAVVPFLQQFRTQRLDDRLSYRRSGLRKMTGATLTSTAVLKAARRSLATHQVISERP